MIKCTTGIQPFNKLSGCPVSGFSAQSTAISTTGTDIFREGILYRNIRTILIFLKTFFSIVIGRLHRLWRCSLRFRIAVGDATELDKTFSRCGGVLCSVFPVSKVIGGLYRFRRCGERFRRAVGRTTELNKAFSRRGGILRSIFPVSKVIGGLYRFRRCGQCFRRAVGRTA
ncbi:hypothetical protein C3992_03943 [Escherichia coli]|nr:hypothetical protein C3992_03943 [Escherichia coli]